MKILILFLACFGASSLLAQDDRAIILQQFERLKGSWEGRMESTYDNDNKTRFSLPAKCTTEFDGKKWKYAVQYEEEAGEMIGGKGECTVSEDGKRMNYDGIIWDVSSITQSNDSTTIVMTALGKEKRKKAEMRRTLFVSDNNFYVLEEVKYDGDPNGYLLRSKHIFRRIK